MLVTINNIQIQVKEYKGQRVVTFKDIDLVHQRPEGTAARNFRENKERFILNEDYFIVDQPDEIRRLGLERPQGGTPEKVILITESGYLMLVKSLNDDLAWNVQRQLINVYFRAKEITQQMTNLQILQQVVNALVEQERKQLELEQKAVYLESKVIDLQRGLVDINIPLRTQFVDLVRKIAITKRLPFDAVFNEIYIKLGKQEHIDIFRRAENRKISKLDVVEQCNLLVKAIRLAKTLYPDVLPKELSEKGSA